MSVAPRQLLSRPERQAAILRGAATAFARTGYAATSMEDVAAASGITKLIVYRHFDSKEDLYRAILQAVSDRLAEEFVAGVQRGERRGLGVRTLLTVARENPEGFRLLWRHAAREDRFDDYAADQRERVVAAARALLSGSTRSRSLPRWAAEAVVSFLVEAVLSWLDEGTPRRDDEFVELVTRGLHGLRTAWAEAP